MEPKWRLEASLEGQVESKRRLEASLEGKMEFKWRSEASLKAKLASKWRLEARLEAQEAPSCAWSAAWSAKLGPRGGKLRLQDPFRSVDPQWIRGPVRILYIRYIIYYRL